jgi:hypothetical protein
MGAAAGRLHGITLNRGSTSSFTVAVGNSRHFGRFAAGRNTYSDYGYSTAEVEGSYGDEYHLMDRSRLVLCPEATLNLERADNLGPDFPVASRTITAVISARVGTLRAFGRVRTLAFVGGGFFRSSNTIHAGGGPFGPDVETTRSNGGFMDMGAGVVLARRVSITTSFRLPIKLKYGIHATVVTATVGL